MEPVFLPLTVSLLSGRLDKATLTVVLEHQDLSVISSILIRVGVNYVSGSSGW